MPQNHDKHRERMRNKFERGGMDALEEHEKLEMLMYFTVLRANTNDRGHSLLKRFGSLSNVLDASVDELQKVDGISHAAAVMLKFIEEVCLQTQKERKGWLEGIKRFSSTDQAGEYLSTNFIGCKDEQIWLLCLDAMGRKLDCSLISVGSMSAVEVNKPKILKKTLEKNAAAVILAHNHPAGHSDPSKEDAAATLQIIELLRYINVELIDHIVVGEKGFCSMRSIPSAKNMVFALSRVSDIPFRSQFTAEWNYGEMQTDRALKSEEKTVPPKEGKQL